MGRQRSSTVGDAILENLSTAVIIIAADKSVVFMNAGAESLLGVSRNQTSGRGLHEFVPDLGELNQLVNKALSHKQTFGHSLSFSLPSQDHEHIEVLCRVSPFAVEPEPMAIVEILDATPWRQLDREKALINQHDASRRIIRQLAHEIRNPLGGIRGAAQLLQRDLVDPEFNEYTQIIVREADRLATLTKDLLGPVRRGTRTSVNVHELTERVRLLTTSDVPDGVRINRDYDPSLPSIRVDQDQIIQALLNIIRNAVQAVGRDGTITIRTRALTNFMIGENRHRLVINIEIEDDGPGVPEDLKDSVFYPLVTSRDEGTGLGLPLAQDLVNRHDGLIEFDSVPGRTVFVVRLPVGSHL